MASDLTEWCAPAIGCERHKGRWNDHRCCHLGNRFVVWVQMDQGYGRRAGAPWWAFIDYVEDLSNGGVIVEGNHATSLEAAQALWDQMVTVMKSGRAPNPDWGN